MLPQISDLFWGCYLLSTYLLSFFFSFFPRLLIFQEEINRKEKANFGEEKSDNKEQAPPLVNSDMLGVLRVYIDKRVARVIVCWW
ncbi:hypothetical protein CLV42_101451 [Chitinophaga ginsengisoli]|uniref:Uncharacterized protein n=1 Tax=Chitinophaga ginsengisoli TaxID=363837 RepID=A0A2P8GNY9_9BACT|nr:hypothetical protein CLV42_101451 [Chitinophaga ginsengisoli]